MQGVYIRKLGKISVKLSVVGVLYLAIAPMGVKFGTDEWTFTKFHPFVSPMCGEKPQNCPLSNLNTGILC